MGCLANREKLFMVEQTKSTEKFRMFLDIDYLTTQEQGSVTIETIKRWTKHLYLAFPTMGPILVSTCVRKQGENFKNGIHLSWPQTTVTSSSAMNVLNNATKELMNFDETVPWSTVLDKSVFKTGLRTIWSYKMIRDTRELVEPYVPLFEIGDAGVSEIPQTKPSASMLERFSILPHGNETNHLGGDSAIISSFNVDDELVKWLKEIYPAHDLSEIKVITKKTHWVICTRSKYCEFICKEHKGNHGWFLVDKVKKVVMFKCHDEEHKGLSGKERMVHPKIIKYLQGLR